MLSSSKSEKSETEKSLQVTRASNSMSLTFIVDEAFEHYRGSLSIRILRNFKLLVSNVDFPNEWIQLILLVVIISFVADSEI